VAVYPITSGTIDLDAGVVQSYSAVVPVDGQTRGTLDLTLGVVSGGNTGGVEVAVVMVAPPGEPPGEREVAHLSVSGGVSSQVLQFDLGTRHFRVDVTPTGGRRLRFSGSLTTHTPA
jgi:hypothetical protein